MIEQEYKTQNLNLSAFLYASGIQFSGVEKVSEGFVFKFTPKPLAEKLVDNYFFGQASVNPKELFARLNDLRDLIFSQRGKEIRNA